MDNLLDYENLVYAVIKKYSNYFDKDDLYQAGMLGLVQACLHFNGDRNTKFSTYAYYYINGEVLKYVRENKTIRVSKDIIKLNSRIEKSKDLMRQRLGREPTITEVSLFLEIEEEKIREAEQATQEIKSLDYSYDEESQELYNSVMTVDKNTSPDIMDLQTEISHLEEEEKKLIIARYYQEMTQSEASKNLGMSQVQVSRKEGKILEKLKQRL